MVNIKKIIRVRSLEEAYELNQARTNVIIGGFMWIRISSRSIANGIDLSGLGLDTIEETAEEFRIGCMASLRSLETHPGLDRAFDGAIAQSLAPIVGVQFRNGATIGGSIYGRFGFSDILTALMALDTYVELHRGGIVPLHEFAAMKPDQDILVRIIIRKDGRKVAYQAQRNTRTDFPVIAAAVALAGDTLCISVGARPAKASLVIRPECGLTGGADPAQIHELAAWAADQFKYGKDLRASAEYRKHLAQVHIRRGLTKILEGENA